MSLALCAKTNTQHLLIHTQTSLMLRHNQATLGVIRAISWEQDVPGDGQVWINFGAFERGNFACLALSDQLYPLAIFTFAYHHRRPLLPADTGIWRLS